MHVDAQTILRQASNSPLAHRLDSRHSQQGMPSEQTVASPQAVPANKRQLQAQRCLFPSSADQPPGKTGKTLADAQHVPAAEAASMGCMLRQSTCCSRRPAELLQALNAAVLSFEAAGQLAMQQQASTRRAQHIDSSDTSSTEDGTTSEDSSSYSSPGSSTPVPPSKRHSVLQQHHQRRDRGAWRQGGRRQRQQGRSTGHASPKPAQLMHRYMLAAAACTCVLVSTQGVCPLAAQAVVKQHPLCRRMKHLLDCCLGSTPEQAVKLGSGQNCGSSLSAQRLMLAAGRRNSASRPSTAVFPSTSRGAA